MLSLTEGKGGKGPFKICLHFALTRNARDQFERSQHTKRSQHTQIHADVCFHENGHWPIKMAGDFSFSFSIDLITVFVFFFFYTVKSKLTKWSNGLIQFNVAVEWWKQNWFTLWRRRRNPSCSRYFSSRTLDAVQSPELKFSRWLPRRKCPENTAPSLPASATNNY